MLHFAPEGCVADLLRKFASKYVSADLFKNDVNLKLNIEDIDLENASFDYIFCSHVLEHVDDKKALVELSRVLTQRGVLIAVVPMIDGCTTTYENEAITAERDREAHFGQYDHIRYYGADFSKRLSQAGFLFEEHTAFGAEAVKYGLLMGEKLFVCRKVQS